MATKLWTVPECPGFTVEQTPGAWALWGPCTCILDEDLNPLGSLPKDDCPDCGGEGEVIVASCGMNTDGTPDDEDMLINFLPANPFTTQRIQ